MFESLRKLFPYTHNSSLAYFDSAATSQKPSAVLDAMYDFDVNFTAPVYRGVYSRAERATEQFEDARHTVAQFINAQADEVIFTQSATDGINFIASTWAYDQINEGDEIILNMMEHHANFIPWLKLTEQKKCVIRFIPFKDSALDYEAYVAMLSSKTKLVACAYTSNVLGIDHDIKFIIQKAHEYGAKVLIDAAQTVANKKIDVGLLKPDFLVFSGHKMVGPTGIGVMYLSRHMHHQVEPYRFGGGMVFSVTGQCATWQQAPLKYEAGTQPVTQAIGLKAAISFMKEHIPFDVLQKHQRTLTEMLHNALKKHDRVKIISPLTDKSHLITFTIKGIHAHDVAAYLDRYNICVRAGHHCAQPLHNYLGVESSVRASFYAYNTIQEVETCINAINKLLR